MSAHAKPEPVGGPLWTPAFKILAAIFGVSALLMIWRFAAGLGATTGLSDGYPWGIWIAFDVVTGTALGCGGYAMAFLVYIFNKGEYHPLVRPAVLTSALGYTMAAVAIHLDVGRPPFIYKIPIFPGWWNLNSVLLEVALCVMAYVGVLWLELSPAFFEEWQKKGAHPTLKKVADTFSPIVNKLMIPLLAVGVLLPSMHQTSLGALMLLGGRKVHGLWQTPFMPLLFLITCVAMGYGVVVMESQLATTIFRRRRETQLLARMAVVPAWLTLATSSSDGWTSSSGAGWGWPSRLTFRPSCSGSRWRSSSGEWPCSFPRRLGGRRQGSSRRPCSWFWQGSSIGLTLISWRTTRAGTGPTSPPCPKSSSPSASWPWNSWPTCTS